MQGPQPSNQPTSYNDLLVALSPMMRQLERLDERTRDLATRADLESLRKEVVARDSLEPQLASLKGQITRVDSDRIDDHKEIENRLDKLEGEQISRQDRLWMRLGQAAAIIALLLALLDFFSTHLRLIP